MSRSRTLVVLIVTALIILVGRIPIIIAPPWDIDEGLYAAVGQALGRGELLYRDVWDNKPPAIYFLFDWISKVSVDYTNFRLAATFFLIVTAILLFGLARRITTYKQALWTLGIFSFLAIVPVFETHISNAEIFFLLPTTLAIYLVVMMEWWGAKLRNYLFVGMLLAVGFLFKTVVAFDALAVLSLLLLKDGLRIKGRFLLMLGGAGLVLILPGIYLVTNNLGEDFIRAAFLNNFGYVKAGNFTTISFIDIANPWVTVSGKLALVAVAILALRRHYRGGLTPVALVYLWLIWTVFGALLSGRPYLHYLMASAGAMALLIPHFWSHVWPLAKFKTLKSSDWVKGLAVLGAITSSLVLGFGGKIQLVASTPALSEAATGYFGNSFSYLTGQISRDEFYRFYGETVTLNLKLQNYLVNNSMSHSKIYVWGNAPWVYYLSGRPHATKYLVAYQLGFVSEAKSEVLAQLRSGAADFIIVTNEPEYFTEAGAPTPKLLELEQILRSSYRLKDRVAQAEVYERVGLADARTP